MKTWILVAQRDAAHVYGWTGPKDPLHPLHDLEHRDDKLVDSMPAKGAEHRPSSSRVHPNVTTNGDEARFIKELAQFLDRARVRGAFERLYLVCEPKFLGELHAHIPAPTKAKIAGEVKKNLGNLAVRELREHLTRDIFIGTLAGV